MVAREESVSEVGSDSESGWSGVSDNSSTDLECADIEALSIGSDQDRFDTAYDAFRDVANDLYYIDLRRYSRGITSEDAAGVLLLDGQEKLQELVHLPRTWPLARLTIPLDFFLDFAALVVTTVAVMELCCTSHRLITRSHRLVTEKTGNTQSKTKKTPNKTTNTKPTKRAQSMKGETSETCSLSLPGA